MPRTRTLIALTLSLFVASPSRAALPPLVPREVLFSEPEQDAPTLSPDGKWLAWGKRGSDGLVNLWVRSLDRDTSWQVTRDSTLGVEAGFWTGDSRGLMFLRDHDGDENNHLLRVDVASGVTRDLTPFPGVRVASVHTDPHHAGSVLVGMNRRDPKVYDIERVDLATGAVTPDTENPGDVVDWTTDGDFRVRACTALRASDSATLLRVRDSVGAPWRTIAEWSMEDAGFDRAPKILGFLDSRTLLVQSWAGTNTSRLVKMDTSEGRVKEVIAQDPRCDVWNIFGGELNLPQLLRSPDGARVRAVGFELLRPEWHVLDRSVQPDFTALLALAGDATLSILETDARDRRWLVGFFGDRDRGRYVIWDRAKQKATPLFEAAPALKKWTLAKMDTVTLRASDGLPLPCYLTLPAGVAAKNLPLVVNPHGGPWFRDVWGWSPEVQWLANRGYAVLQVEFRSSIGFGKAHMNAGDGQFGPGHVLQDLVDATKWAVDGGIADPKRIGIMGWSFGGYSTLAGLAFHPEVFACGVDGVGPPDLGALIESFPPYWSARRKRWITRMGDVVADSALNRRLSPLYHLDTLRAPLLIGHGANDPRVKLVHSETIVKAMRAKGLDVTFIVYPDEGHGFGRTENNRDFYGRAEEFFAKHLGGRAEPWKAVPGSTAQVR